MEKRATAAVVAAELEERRGMKDIMTRIIGLPLLLLDHSNNNGRWAPRVGA